MTSSLGFLKAPVVNVNNQAGDYITNGDQPNNQSTITPTFPPLCMRNKKRRPGFFPNFDYALYGYNIFYGYPLAIGHDPGLTRPIFEADYSDDLHFSADCSYHIPRGFYLAPDVSCKTSFSSSAVVSSKQYSESLEKTVDVGVNWNGLFFGASFDYKKKTTVLDSGSSVYILSGAECNSYFSKMNTEQPPKITGDFINAAKDLKTLNDTYDFFREYGTHYLRYTTFGARYIYENEMDKDEFLKESLSSVSIEARATLASMFSIFGGAGMSESNKNLALDFQSKVETLTISIGAAPPEDGKTLTWASTVKKNPIPIRFQMESIEDLFTPKFMKGHEDLIDYKKIRNLITEGRQNYLKDLMKMGKIPRSSSRHKDCKRFYCPNKLFQ